MKRCEKCGNLIEEGENKKYCSDCLILMAEDSIAEQKTESFGKHKHKSKFFLILKFAILVFCLATILYQIPRLQAVLRSKKPLRYGTYDTDANVDKCIKNLWVIARDLQEGKEFNSSIICPVCKKQYIIKKPKDEIIIYCPCPEKHNLTSIKWSSKKMIPEVKK